MPVTLKMLAQELGLHHSTVAYALSGKGTVKQATRERVREAAAQLGYVPNGLARRMRSKKTNVVGLVVPDVVINYNEFVQQIFRGAVERGYDAQIAVTESKRDWEDKAVRFLMESRVDGMIVKSGFARWDDVPEHHALRQLVSQGIPAILHGFPIEGSPFNYVSLPVQRQAEMLTEHLLRLGHKRFAWLMPVDGPLGRAHLPRVDGTRHALKLAGLPESALTVVTPDAQLDGQDVPADERLAAYVSQTLPRAGITRGRALMRRAMTSAPADRRPTAILCLNETTAIGAIAEAQDMGLRVPQDVAVAATNRSVAAELSPMSLTTADVDMTEAARLSLDLLVETMHDQEIEAEAQALTKSESPYGAERIINGNGHANGHANGNGHATRIHVVKSLALAPTVVVGRSTQA